MKEEEEMKEEEREKKRQEWVKSADKEWEAEAREKGSLDPIVKVIQEKAMGVKTNQVERQE